MPLSPFRLVALAVDLAIVMVTLRLAATWSTAADVSWSETTMLGGAFGIVWLLVAVHVGVYRVPPSRNLGFSLLRMLEAWGVTWGIAGLVTTSMTTWPGFSIWLVLFGGGAAMALARLVMTAVPAHSGDGPPRAVVVGSCASARALVERRGGSDLDVVGVVPFAGEDPNAIPQLRLLGTTEELPRLLASENIRVALVSPSDAALTGDVHRVFRTCNERGLVIQYFPSFLDIDHLRVKLTWNDDRPGLSLHSDAVPTTALLAKRAIDLVGATIGIVALAPVFLACAIAVKLTSPGPVLFRQARVGKAGRVFDCLKFRTMVVGAHAQQQKLRAASIQDGPAFKIPNDPRITPIGRLLRRFSLDELPQLFNVLLGDMSLVGPRPPIPSEVEDYAWWQRRRVSVTPGLTCIWQVYGRNRVSFKRWVEMDLYYIDNWSLWLDLKLIAHTFRVVLRGTGM